MIEREKSIAEQQGLADGYAFTFGSTDPDLLIERIREGKASHTYAGMRRIVLSSLGVEEKLNPEYIIITGCVRVFDSTQGLRNYFTLLDRLAVPYSLLPVSEYCSNLPSLHTASGEEAWQKAWRDAREVYERNLEQAREAGAKHLVHFCSDGYAVARHLYDEFDVDLEPLFYLDILTDRIEGRALRLEPTVVGLFTGCWRERRKVNRKLRVNHRGWRRMVEQIDGVEIRELPRELCCKEDALALVEEAEKLGVDRIVTPCHGVGQARFRALNRIPAMTISDLVLAALVDEAAESAE
ncbi:hypothetical protein N9166_01900 [bacterium]|nr:hypothetical protein [bacterium]